jgi:hypothetical protein
MTSAEDFAEEERRRISEPLESFWRSQMRIATWLALQQRGSEEPPPSAAETRFSRTSAGGRSPSPRR